MGHVGDQQHIGERQAARRGHGVHLKTQRVQRGRPIRHGPAVQARPAVAAAQRDGLIGPAAQAIRPAARGVAHAHHQHAAGCERGADALQHAVLRRRGDVVDDIQDGDHVRLAEIGLADVGVLDLHARLVGKTGLPARHVSGHQFQRADRGHAGRLRPALGPAAFIGQVARSDHPRRKHRLPATQIQKPRAHAALA